MTPPPISEPTHVSDQDLQAYLQGWVDDPTSQSIESHLAECAICEETLVALESDGNTLIQRIREAGGIENASLPRQDLSTPPARLGAYEIIPPIARGGMGAVYLGKHTQLNKTVAIKLVSLPTQASDPAATRFAKEIRAAGGLDHPAIVTATDAGQHDQFHYLVMEYIDGADVSQIARAVGPLKIADACQIIRVAAEALAYAHAKGIVHRDIKPSNLMIDRAGNVQLLDFGLAQVSTWDEVTAELTTVGSIDGNAGLHGPEQAERPDTVDHHADLYSLRCDLVSIAVRPSALISNTESFAACEATFTGQPQSTPRRFTSQRSSQAAGRLDRRHAVQRPQRTSCQRRTRRRANTILLRRACLGRHRGHSLRE